MINKNENNEDIGEQNLKKVHFLDSFKYFRSNFVSLESLNSAQNLSSSFSFFECVNLYYYYLVVTCGNNLGLFACGKFPQTLADNLIKREEELLNNIRKLNDKEKSNEFSKKLKEMFESMRFSNKNLVLSNSKEEEIPLFSNLRIPKSLFLSSLMTKNGKEELESEFLIYGLGSFFLRFSCRPTCISFGCEDESSSVCVSSFEEMSNIAQSNKGVKDIVPIEDIPLVIGFENGNILLHPFKNISSSAFSGIGFGSGFRQINKSNTLFEGACTVIKWIPNQKDKHKFLVCTTNGLMLVCSDQFSDPKFSVWNAIKEHRRHKTTTTTNSTTETKTKSTTKSKPNVYIHDFQKPIFYKTSDKDEDEKKINYESRTNPLEIWEFGKKLMILNVSFSPDKYLLAICFHSGLIEIYDFWSKRLLQSCKSKVGGVLCVSWSPDQKYLVTGGHDDNISIFVLKKTLWFWSGLMAYDKDGNYDDDNHSNYDSEDFSDSILTGVCHNSFVSSVSFDPWRCFQEDSVEKNTRTRTTRYTIGSVGDDGRLALWKFNVVENYLESLEYSLTLIESKIISDLPLSGIIFLKETIQVLTWGGSVKFYER